MKRWTSILIALALAIGATAWIASGMVSADQQAAEQVAAAKPEPAAKELPSVRVRQSEAVDHALFVRVFGHTRADRKLDIRAETAGPIDVIYANKGAVVREGDILATIAPEDRKARLAEARAEVNYRQIAYDAALKLSQKKFRSEVKLAEERSLLAKARAELQRIETEINDLEIRAPFDGVVNDRMVEVGDYVQVGTQVVQMVDLSPVLVVGEISERWISRVSVGDVAGASLSTGEKVNGIVRFVSRAADEKTRTFRVEVAVKNDDRAIGEGITAELQLPLGSRRAHMVSSAILSLDQAGRIGVKSVNDDNRVVFHAVEIIEDTPDGMWLAGLPDSVRLITVGQSFVAAGAVVKPVDEAVIAAKGAAK